MARRIIPHAPGNMLDSALLAVGEVAVDETSLELRVGDGATLGGHALASTAALSAVDGAGKIGFNNRTVADKLLEQAISVQDYMTPEMLASVRGSNPGQVDCSPAFNAAFAEAQAKGRTVFIPDGYYGIGSRLNFGANLTTAQSPAPLGLIGQSKTGTTLKALPTLTGTLLRSWSLAGTTFAYFHIDTSGSTAQAWDMRWRPNDPNRSGPSTQCTMHDILITATNTLAQLPGQSPVTPHLNMDDMNDTYPTNVTVRGGRASQEDCLWSFVASGGLIGMSGCIWTGGYLRWGCQNGDLTRCWGHGIEFATGCLNTTTIISNYPYPNDKRKAVYWSESFASFQSIKGLTIIGGQIGTLKADECYFDLNLYSTVDVFGSEFIGPASVLLGPNCRSDSYATVLVTIHGGKHTGALVPNDVGNVKVICNNFLNDATGYAVTKDWRGTFTPAVWGGNTGGPLISDVSYGKWIRQGNRVDFKFRAAWNEHPGAGSIMRVTGLPGRGDAETIGSAVFDYRGNTLSANVTMTVGPGEIVFYQDGSPLNLPAIGDIIVSGHYTVLS